MAKRSPTPIEQLQTVLARYSHKIDEPETIPFIASVRDKGIISDDEWKRVLEWLDDAMRYLKSGTQRGKSGAVIIDDDPRSADWIRLVGARRLSGYRIPRWASLWLWWIGHDREGGSYWKQIGRIAKTMDFPPFEKERRKRGPE